MRDLVLLVATILFLYPSAVGQVGFLPHLINGDDFELGTPRKTISVDVDNDGDMDIVASGRGIAWYENLDGLGNFGSQNTIETTLDFVQSINIADIDNDGDLDIFAVSTSSNSVSWYENTNDESRFSTEHEIGTNLINCFDIDFLDVDSDDDMDVVVVAETRIYWFENNLDNTSIDYAGIIGNISKGTQMKVADIDSDGLEDIVFASNIDGVVSWLKKNGANDFGPQTLLFTSDHYLSSFDVVDLDGDGDLDILSSSWNDNPVNYYINTDGQGDFEANSLGESLFTAYFIKAIDFDNDQDLDIITSSGNLGITWSENEGGIYADPVSLNNQSEKIIWIDNADLDNDGRTDLLTVSGDERELVWLKNEENDMLSDQHIVSSNLSLLPTDLILTDIDDDGYQDVVYSSHQIDKISWQRNPGAEGEFSAPSELYHLISFATNDKNFIHPVDMDLDGDKDLLVSSSFRSILTYYENTGNNQYNISEIQVGGNTALGRLTTHDIDHDGDLDIFYTSKDHSEFGIIENVDGIFGPLKVESIDVGNGEVFIDINDIDGDGYSDIVAGFFTSPVLNWYKYQPEQKRFSSKMEVSWTKNGRRKILLRDLDGDGDNDIISVVRDQNFNGTKAYCEWYENTDGNGTWSDQIIIYQIAEESFLSFDVGDIDNDNDMDIALTVDDYNSLFLFENLDGSGTFDNGTLISDNLGGIECVQIADLNKDGKKDLVTLSNFENRVMWFENSGLIKNRIGGHVNISIDSFYCDSIQLGVGGIPLHLLDEQGNITTTFTAPNGYYDFKVDSGMYEITIEYPDYFDIDNPIREIEFLGQDSLTIDNDFCLVPKSEETDVSISIIPLTEARPGFESRYRLILQSTGSVPSSGLVRLRYDAEFQEFISSSIPVYTSNNGEVEFLYDSLYPYQSKHIDFTLKNKVPPILMNGDIIFITTSIEPLSIDINTIDNKVILKQEVVGSYDPNDITVIQGEAITIEEVEDYLQYVIRFQNTGTADAINVKVDNVLDEDLDWETFSLVALSHPGIVQITNEDFVSFVFDGIYLPDSTTNEPESHGYISYKIKPKQGSEIGSIFSNEADIYFDFNLPIITNMVHTEIVEITGVNEENNGRVSLVPSVSSDFVLIKSNETIRKVEIYSPNGNKIESMANNLKIDVSDLNNGVYIVFIQMENGLRITKKFIKI